MALDYDIEHQTISIIVADLGEGPIHNICDKTSIIDPLLEESPFDQSFDQYVLIGSDGSASTYDNHGSWSGPLEHGIELSPKFQTYVRYLHNPWLVPIDCLQGLLSNLWPCKFKQKWSPYPNSTPEGREQTNVDHLARKFSQPEYFEANTVLIVDQQISPFLVKMLEALPQDKTLTFYHHHSAKQYSP